MVKGVHADGKQWGQAALIISTKAQPKLRGFGVKRLGDNDTMPPYCP